MRKYTFTEDQFLLHRNEHDGICIECGEVTEGELASDFMVRFCDACGQKGLISFPKALTNGHIHLTDEEPRV